MSAIQVRPWLLRGPGDGRVRKLQANAANLDGNELRPEATTSRRNSLGLGLLTLLLYYAAGDAIAGVAGWVGHEVVGFGVNHERCATVVEE